jgi:hypothetical protein
MEGQQRDTRKEIELAISRIQHGRPKRVTETRRLCIAAVAEEAGVSNATIHNRYPDIAERIRKMVIDELPDEIKRERDPGRKKNQERERLKALRQEVERLKTDLSRSQSINLRLLKENEILKARGATVGIAGKGER